jgi:4-hydroxy-tetrahydrodipicolinate synthase
VASNVAPAEIAKLVDLFRAGDLTGARRQHQRLRPLVEAMFIETNPGPVKAAMAMRGLATSEVRLPMVYPGEGSVARIRAVLNEMELV